MSRNLRALMLTLLLTAVVMFVSFAAGGAGAAPAPQAQPTPDTITFNNNTMADFSATSGEPIVKVDPRDRIFATSPFGVSTTLSLLWRSDDGGRSYRSMGAPVVRDAVTGPGGGDTDVDFDAKGRVYYVDLSAACVTAAVSEDGGQTFPAERTNYVTCVSDETSGAAVDDRQWVAGSVSYDLLLKNASAQAVYTPLAARVAKLTSPSGGVTVANADNGQTGAGAAFDYGGAVGGDATLSPNETTVPRRLRFNNPSNEPFTAEFQVVGQLPRGSTAGTTTSSGTSTSGGGTGSMSTGTNSTSGSVTALVTSVLRVTYSPLLGTAAVERLK